MIKINYGRLTLLESLAALPCNFQPLERSERVFSQRGCRGQNAPAATSTTERWRAMRSKRANRGEWAPAQRCLTKRARNERGEEGAPHL